MKTDIDIARACTPKSIEELAPTLGFNASDLIPYGRTKAKLSWEMMQALPAHQRGSLVLVTAMSPTPAGEGKTTTSIGLYDALCSLGHKALLCLREPSLGPCFGVKGGASGGGLAQVVPMEDINLHFTGDLHAISTAHNLLATMIDNHIHWGNALKIDVRRISFKRVVDLNDRSLRHIVLGLGGLSHGVVRESGFDITVASEIMAIICLATDYEDLERRLGDIIIGYTEDKQAVRARDLKAHRAMTVVLKDAFLPNLVQTLEHNPVLIHGGPFANIAHGCSSVIATKTALKLADIVVTEAGFGADLGAEKFFNIKCRKAQLAPQAVVLVVTVRAVKMHAGVAKGDLTYENVQAVVEGFANVKRHIDNIKQFGLPVVVAINHFIRDTEQELNKLIELCAHAGVKAIISKHWQLGSAGAAELAKAVLAMISQKNAHFLPIYADDLPLIDKIERIATNLYGAKAVRFTKAARRDLDEFSRNGFAHLPVCMAKTQYSFSSDPKQLGAPKDHIVEVRAVRLCAGAGFVVAICGDIMTMPGLPREPAAVNIYLDRKGQIQGLF